jgi:hypothetical protein
MGLLRVVPPVLFDITFSCRVVEVESCARRPALRLFFVQQLRARTAARQAHDG